MMNQFVKVLFRLVAAILKEFSKFTRDISIFVCIYGKHNQ